jgi:hypothetical protein
MIGTPSPFGLSLSKPSMAFFLAAGRRKAFDRLRPNGLR